MYTLPESSDSSRKHLARTGHGNISAEAPSCFIGWRTLIWLAVALAILVLVALSSTLGLILAGENIKPAMSATAPAQTISLYKGDIYSDSWSPMLKAYNRKVADPGCRMYDILLDDHVIKFQYPPSSLLIFDLLPRSITIKRDRKVESQVAAKSLMAQLSLAAFLLTIMTAAISLEVRLGQVNHDRPTRPSFVAARVLLVLALGLTYYPLLHGYELGQIQVFLNSLLAFAILSYLLGWEVLSGVCIGVCCLFKPQYGVLLLWSLLSRRWRFVLGLAGVLILGMAVSVARFGLSDHLGYLEALRVIARHGEAFWPNQSVNGLMNRLLCNGDPLVWSNDHFAPYHPTVYTLSLISSLLLLALALRPWHLNRAATSGPVDLMVVVVAATMASPVAWEHHYGAFLTIFAVSLPDLIRVRPFGRLTGPLLACSYIASASVLLRPKMIFVNPWLGLAGSHLFFGGIMLFALLLALRSCEDRLTSPIILPRGQ